jgi:hypothetical protein
VEEASKPWKFYIDSLLVQVLAVGAYPPEPGKFDGKKDAAARTDKSGILWKGRKPYRACPLTFPPILRCRYGSWWIRMGRNSQRELRLLYRSWIEAGADIVVGSHPMYFKEWKSIREN